MASFYDLFKPTRAEEEKAAMEYARLNPSEQAAMQGRLFERGAVKAVEDTGRKLLGLPESAEGNREAAAVELRKLAQTVRPGTTEFFDAAIPILQKYGMPGEAADLERQRHLLEVGKGETASPLIKLQRDRDALAKRPDAASPNVQAALAAIDRKIAEFGTRAEKSQNDPEYIKLLDAYDAALSAGDDKRAAMIKQAIDAWIKAKERSGVDVSQERLDLEKRRVDLAEKKDTDKERRNDESTVGALQSTVRAVDTELQAAQRLLAHPGLTKIIGPRAGAVPGAAIATLGEDAAGAYALFLTVEGQTFIRALQDLKATSRTGASGLGQLTEREGDKIQSAKTSITRQQGPDQFKRTLAAYIALLASTRKLAEGELVKAKAEVPAAPAPVIDVEPAAAVKPRGARERAALERPAPTAGRVKMRSPDGKVGSVPADQADAAEAAGYTRVQ